MAGELKSYLAVEFIKLMRQSITPGQLLEADEINATDPDANWCASHDFCDANVVMDSAFHNVMHRAPDFDCDDDIQLWSDAWTMAKHMGFSLETEAEQLCQRLLFISPLDGGIPTKEWLRRFYDGDMQQAVYDYADHYGLQIAGQDWLYGP